MLSVCIRFFELVASMAIALSIFTEIWSEMTSRTCKLDMTTSDFLFHILLSPLYVQYGYKNLRYLLISLSLPSDNTNGKLIEYIKDEKNESQKSRNWKNDRLSWKKDRRTDKSLRCVNFKQKLENIA